MHRHKYIATVYSYLVNKLFSLSPMMWTGACTLSAINLTYIPLANDTADLSFSGTASTYL